MRIDEVKLPPAAAAQSAFQEGEISGNPYPPESAEYDEWQEEMDRLLWDEYEADAARSFLADI